MKMSSYGMAEIPLILTAAGASSRMGAPKGLLDYRGALWIKRQVLGFGISGGKNVILVLGNDLEKYCHSLELDIECPAAQRWGDCLVVTVVNPDRESAMFVSQQLAMTRLINEDDFRYAPAAFLQPIDVPLPAGSVLSAMSEAFCQLGGTKSAVMPQTGGHPVLLGRGFMQQLTGLDTRDPNSRLDVQLRQQKIRGEVVAVRCEDPRLKTNLNTPDDWLAYCESGLAPGMEYTERSCLN